MPSDTVSPTTYQLNAFSSSIKDKITIDLTTIENFNRVIKNQTEVVVLHGSADFDINTMKIVYTPSPFYDSVELYVQVYYLDSEMRTYTVKVELTDPVKLPPTVNPDLLLGSVLFNNVESGGLKYNGEGIVSFDSTDKTTLATNYGGKIQFVYGGKTVGEFEHTEYNIGNIIKFVYDDKIFSVTIDTKDVYVLDGNEDTGGSGTEGGSTDSGSGTGGSTDSGSGTGGSTDSGSGTGGSTDSGSGSGTGGSTDSGSGSGTGGSTDSGSGTGGSTDSGSGSGTGTGTTEPPPKVDNSSAGIKAVESVSSSSGGSAICESGDEKAKIDFKMITLGDGFVKLTGSAEKKGCVKESDKVDVKVNGKSHTTTLSSTATMFIWDVKVASNDVISNPKVTSFIYSTDKCLHEVITKAEIEFPPENIKTGYVDKDEYIDACVAANIDSAAPPKPIPPLPPPASTETGMFYQMYFCKIQGVSFSEQEIDGMIEAIQQLNNTLYEIHTGIPDAVYPDLGAGKKPSPIADREANKSKKNIHNTIDVLATILAGKKFDNVKDTENNLSDLISKVITGKKYDDLVLGKTGGDTGEYDTTLNGRLHKTTELLTGILASIFTEDDIKSKLEGLDLNDKDSIAAALGAVDEKASFLKNSTHVQERITRAIEALVISYVYSDLKGDVRMANLSRADYPENIREPFWTELKEAYTKVAGDFTHNLRNLDRYDPNNHKYPMYPNSDTNLSD